MIFSPAKLVARKPTSDWHGSQTASRLVMRRGEEETGSIEVSVRHGDGDNAADAATYWLRHRKRQCSHRTHLASVMAGPSTSWGKKGVDQRDKQVFAYARSDVKNCF
jgi:hypothetical protein